MEVQTTEEGTAADCWEALHGADAAGVSRQDRDTRHSTCRKAHLWQGQQQTAQQRHPGAEWRQNASRTGLRSERSWALERGG